MPANHDVGRSGIEGNTIERRVCLDEPAMLLCFDPRHDQIERFPSQSTHGESSTNRVGKTGDWNTNRAQIICTQVVPLFERGPTAQVAVGPVGSGVLRGDEPSSVVPLLGASGMAEFRARGSYPVALVRRGSGARVAVMVKRRQAFPDLRILSHCR